jgi:hypothetical protein
MESARLNGSKGRFTGASHDRVIVATMGSLMSEVRLTDEEAQQLRRALQVSAVRTRTGELGIMHGLARFVSTQSIFKRPDLANLDSAARKLGLGGVRRAEK